MEKNCVSQDLSTPGPASAAENTTDSDWECTIDFLQEYSGIVFPSEEIITLGSELIGMLWFLKNIQKYHDLHEMRYMLYNHLTWTA